MQDGGGDCRVEHERLARLLRCNIVQSYCGRVKAVCWEGGVVWKRGFILYEYAVVTLVCCISFCVARSVYVAYGGHHLVSYGTYLHNGECCFSHDGCKSDSRSTNKQPRSYVRRTGNAT